MWYKFDEMWCISGKNSIFDLIFLHVSVDFWDTLLKICTQYDFLYSSYLSMYLSTLLRLEVKKFKQQFFLNLKIEFWISL